MTRRPPLGRTILIERAQDARRKTRRPSKAQRKVDDDLTRHDLVEIAKPAPCFLPAALELSLKTLCLVAPPAKRGLSPAAAPVVPDAREVLVAPNFCPDHRAPISARTRSRFAKCLEPLLRV